MTTFTEQLERYNEALRQCENEERQRAAGTWTSAARSKANKREMLSLIKTAMVKEFTAAQDYLSGKIPEPKTERIIGGKVYKEELYYFAYPQMFEDDIKTLDDNFGELSDIDFAWIKNTRALIKKYYAILYMEAEDVAQAV